MSELNTVDEAQIRAKAFELWLERGAPIGSPEDDWFSAKMLLESPPPPAVSAPSETWASESVPLGLSIRSETTATLGNALTRAQRRAKPKSSARSKARASERR